MNMGVLGCDVEFRKSLAPREGAGDGLFVLKDFNAGSTVTFYDGVLKHMSKLIGKYKAPCNMVTTHFMSVRGFDLVIVGLSRSTYNWAGRGGGSFANHWPEKANVKFKHTTHEIDRFCEDDFVTYKIGAIALVAKRDLLKGEEVYVRYGPDSALAMSWQI
jgi:hypothetical protein